LAEARAVAGEFRAAEERIKAVRARIEAARARIEARLLARQAPSLQAAEELLNSQSAEQEQYARDH
jgi:hypothetical protein